MKHIYFTVTNDLNFDQRMQRICSSLAANGYKVSLIGRSEKNSLPLAKTSFHQHRLSLIFNKGFLFYAEYNIRLFCYLWSKKIDAICAIDLDTILPCLLLSKIKSISRIYDAHELFCEMKEVVSRPFIRRIWKALEKRTVPQFKNGYTVNSPLKSIFKKDYGVDYCVIRNMPLLSSSHCNQSKEDFIIYQGAVNEGRSFETLIPAFQFIDLPLHIYGDGNFLVEAKAIANKFLLQDKVVFKGSALPAALKQITPKAILGVNLIENNGLNNYYSLANRFFDYIHAGIPQLCVGYPAYKEINDQFKVAYLIEDLSPTNIATSINIILSNKELQKRMAENCKEARDIFNWQEEEKRLLDFYHKLFLSE